ncbi:MAG: hypothetical protein K0Q91_705 [Fibrobacteria bacterium]|jgi:hypothetical protein|nr:hypothetical protein [Fibrobacteria bacterium]
MKFKILSALLLGLAAWPLQAQEDYSQWAFSRGIAINTNATGANVASSNAYDFPLLIRLTKAQGEVFANSRANGADIRFTLEDGVTRLPHQIERWDSVNQVAAIWVRTTIYGSDWTPTGIRMYWGNGMAADSSSGPKVFNDANGFRAVWHMGNKFTIPDRANAVASAGGGGTLMRRDQMLAVTPTPGLIGFADSLRGNGLGDDGDHLQVGTLLAPGGDGSATLTMWVKPDAGGASTLAFFGNSGANDIFSLGRSASGKVMARIKGASDRTVYGPDASLTPGEWQMIAAVTNGSTLTLYRNGVQIASGTGSNFTNVSRSLNFIGRSGITSDSAFGGLIDEVTLSKVARSAEWIRLAYETQRPENSAVTIGALITGALDIPYLHSNEIRLGNPANYVHAEHLSWRSRMVDGMPGDDNELQVYASAIYLNRNAPEGTVTTMLSPQSIHTPRIYATEVVSTPKWEVPDYVFEKDYVRRSLGDLEAFVREHKHLPDIPSASEMKKGVDLAELNLRLLKSVEELSLHVIDLAKDLSAQKHHSAELEKKVLALKAD